MNQSDPQLSDEPARWRFTLTQLLVATTLIGMGSVCMVTMFGHHHHHKAPRTQCSNNLRQLGLAAIQYSDDKRFFPHIRAIDQLDGDETTNHTPRTVRGLQWFGYHDNPEGWICPSSYDTFQPLSSKAALNDVRVWFWDQQYFRASARSPLSSPQRDPALQDTSELSYAWTRKGMSVNVRSNRVLGADRALKIRDLGIFGDARKPGHIGNHRDGWNVLKVDGTVSYYSTDYDLGPGKPKVLDWLIGTRKGESALSMHNQGGE